MKYLITLLVLATFSGLAQNQYYGDFTGNVDATSGSNMPTNSTSGGESVVSVNGTNIISFDSFGNAFYGQYAGFTTIPPTITGIRNVGFGSYALDFLSSGSWNTSLGYGSSANEIVGSSNTAVGYQSLAQNNGSNNIAIGLLAGFNLSGNESSNIDIGNPGVTGENNVIRIGTNQMAAYIAGTLHAPGFVGSMSPTNLTGTLSSNSVWICEDFTAISSRNESISSPEFYSLNGVNTSATSQEQGQTIKSAGWITNLQFWFYGTAVLGTGTNVTLQFETNGVVEKSLQAIITGGAANYYYAADLTDSFYWPGGSNIIYFYSTNNIASSLVGAGIYTPSFSFQLLKQTP